MVDSSKNLRKLFSDFGRATRMVLSHALKYSRISIKPGVALQMELSSYIETGKLFSSLNLCQTHYRAENLFCVCHFVSVSG